MSAQPASVAAPTTVARNALYLVLGQIVTTALGVLVSALLGRTLGPADFGLFYLVSTMTSFAFTFIEWGQSSYVIRQIAQRHAEAGRLLGGTVAFRAGSAVVVGAGAVLVTWLLGYDQRTSALLALMVAATLPLSCALASGFVFRSFERMDLDAIANILAGLLSAGVLIPVMLLGGGLFPVVLAEGVAGVFALLSCFVLLRRLPVGRITASVQTLREILVGGASLFSLQLAVVAQPYFDAIFLSKLAPAAAIGWYAAAARFLGTLLIPANVIGASLYPRLSQLFVYRPAEYTRVFRAGLRPLLWLGVLAAVGTWLFADIAISLVFGVRGYTPAISILKLFALLLPLLFVNTFVGSALIAAHKQRPLAVAKVASVAVGVALDLILIPVCQTRLGNGGLGVVLALVGNELSMLATGLWLLPRGLIDWRTLGDVVRGLVAAGGTGLVGAALAAASPLLRVPADLLTFGLLSLLTGLVSKADLAMLRDALRSRRGAQTQDVSSLSAATPPEPGLPR